MIVNVHFVNRASYCVSGATAFKCLSPTKVVMRSQPGSGVWGRGTMRISAVIAILGVSLLPAPVFGQANPGPHTGPVGSWQSPSNNPGTGMGDIPGSGPGVPGAHSADGALKGA